MSIIFEKIKSKIENLKNEFRINKIVAHNGIKGELNESELSSLIKEVIPQRYRVSKGVIENTKGDQSNETDILIYDDEILPAYIRKDLTFVPVEAVKYIFEVKSSLNSTELKTTFSKFKKFKSIGGLSPTALFAYSSDTNGSELSRYRKLDIDFLINPAIKVLCVSDKSYYYNETKEYYIKDYLPQHEIIQKIDSAKELNLEITGDIIAAMMRNDEFLNKMPRSEFALLIKKSILFDELTSNLNDRKLILNKIDYSEIKFKVHKWIGIESCDSNIELAFLSKISNTLSKENFGKYLLREMNLKPEVFAICYEDMWGNLSCQDFAEEGLKYDPDEFSFSFETSIEKSRIIFKIEGQNCG
nr:DUF6602 domain-containing protein [Comamonas koreensis]